MKLASLLLLLILPFAALAQQHPAPRPALAHPAGAPLLPPPAAHERPLDSLWVQADTYSRHLGELLHFTPRQHDQTRLLTYLELRDLRRRREQATGLRPRTVVRRVSTYYMRMLSLLPRRFSLSAGHHRLSWPEPGTQGCPRWARLPLPQVAENAASAR